MSDDQIPKDSKLTTSKRRWAAEGKFLTGHISRPETERLPPGQHLVKNWPVLDLGQQPIISTDSWRLEVRAWSRRRSTSVGPPSRRWNRAQWSPTSIV